MSYRIECERIWNDEKIACINHVAGWLTHKECSFRKLAIWGMRVGEIFYKVKCKKRSVNFRRKKIKWPWKN